ncbi:DUF3296 domain-containing protein [Citrobacter sp. L55]|uniref:YagK/YfjJ domain-containing protein n=1 Tax=Citrobacter sp. L55 TaxID=1981983 RepID=UPI000C76DE04|nr:inovirus-type Gp2 protein [Citrobacter sp. L55]PLC64564.1 DUF3296 domain-containing protein [Citrobacter sp. L55]
MNHSYIRASDTVSADAVSTRAFLQQAVDHYPRLAAFSFTALLPRSGTMTDNRALILRFHTEVWLRIGEYSRQRQQARQSSPPTVLRWMWESVSAPECKMVLLMNLDTLGALRDVVVQQDMSRILREAWCAVIHTDNNVTSMSSFIISRSDKNSFTVPFGRLKAGMDNMVPPVITARTGVICP